MSVAWLNNVFHEQIQLLLAKKDYTIVESSRIATGTAAQGLIDLLRNCQNGTEADRMFGKFALETSEGSFSQYQQELFALWASGSKTDGTFVEFGAADGLTHSNTYLLEHKYNWKGLLIEPLPFAHAEAKRRRPACSVIRGAVDPLYSDQSRTLEFVVAGQLSTISDYKDVDKHSVSRAARRKISVPTINLITQIEQSLPGKVIDYMSIDVEGPEADIITGFDFDRINVRSLTVEVNDRADDASRIAAFLEARGFIQPFSRVVTRDDLWFVRQNA